MTPCIYRNARQSGNPDHWSNRYSCSCPAVTSGTRSVFIPKSRCNGCTFAVAEGPTLPFVDLSDCVHRGKVIKDAPCGCATVHKCSRFPSAVCTTANHATVAERFRAAGDERAVHNCTGCGEHWIPELDETELLYVHFNPCGFSRITENVFTWWESLGPLRGLTRGLHLVFRDDEPILPRATRVKATEGQQFFIKEALINRLVAESTKKYVAWVDADIVYPDHRWLMHGLRLLPHFDAVQLFDTLSYSNVDGSPKSSRVSRAKSWLHKQEHSGAPGGAWLMEREKFIAMGGLPEFRIVGGGDVAAFDAWTARQTATHSEHFSDGVTGAMQAYQERCQSVVRSIGYVPVNAHHLPHGTAQGRGYDTRQQVLAILDPATDLQPAGNGLPEIVNPAAREAAAEYMQGRNEDAGRTYWEKRQGHQYYRTAVEFVKQLAPEAKTLLDVGGGITAGCRYLEWLPDLERTSVETQDSSHRSMEGVRTIIEDFRSWDPDKTYDVALCLQVLEHIEDAPAFAAKLFSIASQAVVISIPYRWQETGQHKTHVHGELTEADLQRWTGRDPDRVEIIEDARHKRLVAGYRLEQKTCDKCSDRAVDSPAPSDV